MSHIDHHAEPFDAGTLKKLEIYKKFLQAWIQVFLHTAHHPGPLRFFDFFSGPGQDKCGQRGSPLILMDELASHRGLIADTGREIKVLFNDFAADKSKTLHELCLAKGSPFMPAIESHDFGKSFELHKNEIGLSPSFVLLDQCGVKFVTREIFQYLAQCRTTDILFFFASSSQRRFSEQFANELNIPPSTPYWQVHRHVADCYRSWAPKGYFVGQYSIKKGSNIYGLIFGSNHWRGMQKFLSTDSGEEANYEIDLEAKQGDLFGGHKLTRIEQLAEEIEDRIRNRSLLTDGQVAYYCLEQGILPSKIAPNLYQKLKTEGVLKHGRDQQPRYSDQALKEPRRLVFA